MAATPSTPTPYRFIREEYYRMGEAGLFADERVELLDGEIISMPSQSPLHASSITRIISLMLREFDSVLSVRACAPIVLNNWSELEPDVAICRFDSDDYRHEHPKASDILLLIEIADTSLAYDRRRKTVAMQQVGFLNTGL